MSTILDPENKKYIGRLPSSFERYISNFNPWRFDDEDIYIWVFDDEDFYDCGLYDDLESDSEESPRASELLDARPCQSFVRNGTCRRGEQCHFSHHPTLVDKERKRLEKMSQQLCRALRNGQTCRYGEKRCWYSHSPKLLADHKRQCALVARMREEKKAQQRMREEKKAAVKVEMRKCVECKQEKSSAAMRACRVCERDVCAECWLLCEGCEALFDDTGARQQRHDDFTVVCRVDSRMCERRDPKHIEKFVSQKCVWHCKQCGRACCEHCSTSFYSWLTHADTGFRVHYKNCYRHMDTQIHGRAGSCVEREHRHSSPSTEVESSKHYDEDFPPLGSSNH